MEGFAKMSRDQAGRMAGHHITPGQGWRWQKFGDRVMLVTDGGGADVVLSIREQRVSGRMQPALATCSPDGVMVPLTADHPLARLLAGIPAIVEVAQLIRDRNDRPLYHPKLCAALEAAGL